MNLFEKMVKAYQNNEVMPLKGHTKITLTDVKTGKTKVVEKDNMVTNAVAHLLSRNWSGLADFHSLLPLKNLFGGVLLFAGNITEDADNYNPPNELVNGMTACAGQTAHSTANPYRGNPNGGETVVTDSSVKFVWDWATNQGNGPINCVCLCPNGMGNMGLKPFDNTQNPAANFTISNTDASVVNSWTRAQAILRPISIESDGQTGKAIWWSGTTFEEITVKHDFYKFGIMRGYRDFIEVSSRTATTRTFPSGLTSICQDDDYYYCYGVSGSTSLMVDKISKADMTVENLTLTLSGVSLNTSTWTYYTSNEASIYRSLPRWGFDGTYLYLPKSGNATFIKINLSNQADVDELGGTVSIRARSSGRKISPIRINDGLIYGENWFINGSNVYPMADSSAFDAESTDVNDGFANIVRNGSACYMDGLNLTTGSQDGRVGWQRSILVPTFLSTINNLDNQVDKTSSQTMKVEYTLTEA